MSSVSIDYFLFLNYNQIFETFQSNIEVCGIENRIMWLSIILIPIENQSAYHFSHSIQNHFEN